MNIGPSIGLFIQGVAHFVGSLDPNRIWESRNTTVAIGWLLGFLSAPLMEWVKDRRRKRQLEVAIRRELQEQQYQLALVSFTAEMDFGDGFNRDFILRTKQLIAGYRRANLDPEMMGKVDHFLKMSDEDLAGFVAHSKAKDTGKVIPPFESRYLDSVMSDLRLFSPDFQTKLLSIRADLGKLNFHIQTATDYERLTFTLSDPGNHEKAVNNNRLGLRQVTRLTRRIAEKIDALYPSKESGSLAKR